MAYVHSVIVIPGIGLIPQLGVQEAVGLQILHVELFADQHQIGLLHIGDTAGGKARGNAGSGKKGEKSL